MKVQILGIRSRDFKNKDTGVVRVYTDLYYQKNFSEADIKEGARGIMVDKVNTTLNCSNINPGDVVNFDYGPTGYRNQDGSEQIRLLAIDVIEPAKSK